jgi:hypothetical protein
VVEDLERIPCPLQAHGCQPIKRDGSYEDNPLFGYDKLNLDGIIFDCCVDALLELNRMEWSFGSSFRKEKGMMLLFTGPGFIYVCATDKKTIVEQLSRLFKVDQTPPVHPCSSPWLFTLSTSLSSASYIISNLRYFGPDDCDLRRGGRGRRPDEIVAFELFVSWIQRETWKPCSEFVWRKREESRTVRLERSCGFAIYVAK